MPFSKAVIVLSSAKLHNEDFFIKPTRSFINMLKIAMVQGSILEKLHKVVL